MAKAQEAADAIRASIKMYKNLAEYADFLEGIGSLEQAKAEAERACAQSKQLAAESKERLHAIGLEVATQRDILTGENKEAKLIAANTVRRAQEEAVLIKERAATEAEAVIANAVASGASQKAALSAELVAVQAKLKAADAELAQVARAKGDAQAELDIITGKIEAAKAQIANLLA